jgi:hypothetical protein
MLCTFAVRYRWLAAGPGSEASPTYPVQYQEYYEPYVIMAAGLFLPYDERFRGYGLNKCVHLRALSHLRQLTFSVLAGQYAIADSHERSAAHSDTYGSDSGYRKYVLSEMYDTAVAEMGRGEAPRVSNNTSAMLLPLTREPAGRPGKASARSKSTPQSGGRGEASAGTGAGTGADTAGGSPVFPLSGGAVASVLSGRAGGKVRQLLAEAHEDIKLRLNIV